MERRLITDAIGPRLATGGMCFAIAVAAVLMGVLAVLVVERWVHTYQGYAGVATWWLWVVSAPALVATAGAFVMSLLGARDHANRQRLLSAAATALFVAVTLTLLVTFIFFLVNASLLTHHGE